MTSKLFFSNWAKLKEENSVLKIVLLGLTAAVIVSSIANYKLYQEKTVVVMPPNITKEFHVTGNRLSFEYIEQVGYYLSDRILSISPENAQNSFDTVLPFLTTNPEAIKVIRENLALQTKVIKENDIYQVFYPMRTMVNEQGKKFSVEGVLKKMSGNNEISTGRATITFDFIVKDGRMIIKGIEVK
jgi:conjugal transfer pilus assembly protein TraE